VSTVTTAPTGPHRVRKAFTAAGDRLPAGTVVDVTGWRNAYQLVDRGWLVVIPASDTEAPQPAKKAPAKKAAAKKPAPKIED
jgi:hypothetical protein